MSTPIDSDRIKVGQYVRVTRVVTTLSVFSGVVTEIGTRVVTIRNEATNSRRFAQEMDDLTTKDGMKHTRTTYELLADGPPLATGWYLVDTSFPGSLSSRKGPSVRVLWHHNNKWFYGPDAFASYPSVQIVNPRRVTIEGESA